MHLELEKQTFLRALSLVLRSALSKPENATTPSLIPGTILLQAEINNALKIRSNCNQFVTCTEIVCGVHEEGSIVCNAKILYSLVRSFPSDEIFIQSSHDPISQTPTISITCGRTQVHLSTQSPEDYPVYKEMIPEEIFSIPGYILKDLIKKTVFAASTQETRKILTGVFFHFTSKRLEMAAVDGYRLSVCNTELESEFTQTIPEALRQRDYLNKKIFFDCPFPREEVRFVVPRNVLIECGKVLEDAATVKIGYIPTQVCFVQPDITITSDLINGEFMNYRTTIPKKFNYQIALNLAKFKECVKRCDTLMSGKNPIILEMRDGEMRISGISEVGSISDVMPMDDFVDIRVGYNATYLLDALSVINSKDIIMSINSPITPCVITAPDDPDFLYMLLPVRV